MDDESRVPHHAGTAESPAGTTRTKPDAPMLRILNRIERTLLYLVSAILLAVAGGIIVMMFVTAARNPSPWPERAIILIEELLLVLIVLEIFVTVRAHLEGGRIQLEPFIIVGVIAVVRHILSVVVRLSVTMTMAERRDQFTEMAVYAGVAFILVLALAIARWSKRS
ncbi:phosphate-starvation-inducible PsiE family protein [Microtetraspora sp. NBRC 16547]|uniref:phosphate-starvation-inducible PsiE family protein n=1 Tax=Microtetraspora sp. NBRC 16547 TaxID=3030993 RepID=UPI0024A31357|nr:phosphate-starvation-inducible PsiE family protein [Microtetraspora sp. NBRC 16547]GLX01555.1 hypothetical protein Misp02_56410 [Microtetraspora sp. NBRC 16547]